MKVIKESETQVIFQEKGSWKTVEGKEIDFRNQFRWTIDKENSLISVEHMRPGVKNPIFFFHLVPSKEGMLSSIGSHLHKGDVCFGQIFCENESIRLNWRRIGLSKNEEIDYFYS